MHNLQFVEVYRRRALFPNALDPLHSLDAPSVGMWTGTQ